MIVCTLADAPGQLPAHEGLRKALAFLQQAQERPDGRVDIDGDRVFALYQSYETLAGGNWAFEGHRRFIDVQFVLAGEEVMGWAPAGQATVTKPYDAQGDAWLGAVPQGIQTAVHVAAGELAVFWPGDAHAPRRAAGKPGAVKKIVLKVAV